MTQLFKRFTAPQILRADTPLTDDQINRVAPSIFAAEKHASRSERYAYIPTSTVLTKLRAEGFHPFMACQTRVRDEAKREHTRHMLRLRHASQVSAQGEANEILLLNSHDGTSSYQMIAGQFRFICANGLVCGDIDSDIRVPHKGDVVDRVIDGAFEVLDGFTRVVEEREEMKALTLAEDHQAAFARAALVLRYDKQDGKPAPITESDLLTPRRSEDREPSLWNTFNRVQEHLVTGGIRGRNAAGRRAVTRPVTGIDQGVKLNRALWVLANEMAKLAKA
jgi:hypothetical protein